MISIVISSTGELSLHMVIIGVGGMKSTSKFSVYMISSFPGEEDRYGIRPFLVIKKYILNLSLVLIFL
jgi:hypothetical protein